MVTMVKKRASRKAAVPKPDLNAALLTADTRILRYARETASVRVHDARL
jgi:hypothetical protein